MKTSFLKQLALVVTLLASYGAQAQVSRELESLGDKQTAKRAARLESRTRVGIVQNRTVSRDWRPELGAYWGPVAFGDSYVNTHNVGARLDLHVNPHFSLGVQYSKAFNEMTSEGRNVFNQARTTDNFTVPQISYPEETYMGLLNWYMFYGKINFFDVRVIQFDIYSLAGYGQTKVTSDYGTKSETMMANTWTAGLGIGFWIAQHLTSRVEVKYQNYSDKVYSGTRDLNLMVASVGLGVLL